MKYDGYIFDVDGVLIDTRSSFSQAVILAVKEATGSAKFQLKHYKLLKNISGFNNDWDVAVTGAAWLTFYEILSFSDFIENIKNNDIVLESTSDSFRHNISKLAMEAYGGITACKKLYEVEPKTILIEGTWKNEIPLVQSDTIAPILTKSGILTGRNKKEMDLAFDILGWDMPIQFVKVSDNPKRDKPNPTKLIQLVKDLNSKIPIYFGDSIDDYFTVENFKHETGIQMDFCFVGNYKKHQRCDYKTKSVSNFLTTVGVME